MKKTIVITGASDGIGKALAKEMAKRGYNLGLSARRDNLLQELKAEIQADFPATEIETAVLDVTDYIQVEKVLNSFSESLGKVDIVVANAGIARSGKAETAALEDQLSVINTNLNGAIATVSAALKIFRKQGHGHIVGTASVAGYRGLPRNAAYSASKAGLATYMDAVRLETLNENIDVSVINPGFIDTEINRSLPSRPFVIDVVKGASLFADLIEKKVKISTVPRMPWAVLGPLMRILPDSVVAKM
jgi:short-subunit dehydrogenase